jgi:hypothetical protein
LKGSNRLIFFIISKVPGLSNRIGFDSIRFSIEMLQKPFDTIRFRFDIDSIQKTIRFDTNPPQQSLNFIGHQ